MPRLVVHEAQAPHKLEIGGETKWICRCGLSKNQPFCDGSHKRTKDEEPGKVYAYDASESRVEIRHH